MIRCLRKARTLRCGFLGARTKVLGDLFLFRSPQLACVTVAYYIAVYTSSLAASPRFRYKIAFSTGGKAAFLAVDKIEFALPNIAKEELTCTAAPPWSTILAK